MITPDSYSSILTNDSHTSSFSLSFPIIHPPQWLRITAKAKKLESAKMLSRAAICRVATGATLFGFLILACMVLNMRFIASLLAAVFDIVCIVVYFIAAGKLERVVGNKSKSGKSIVVLSRRIARSLIVAIVGLMFFTVTENLWTPASAGVLASIVPPVFIVAVWGGFGVGIFVLLRFLDKALRNQGRRANSGRSIVSRSTHNSAGETGNEGRPASSVVSVHPDPETATGDNTTGGGGKQAW
jgi:hypothetical protein